MDKTKEMPKSIESERALLGQILTKETGFEEAQKYVTLSSMFYNMAHKRIFGIMQRLHSENKKIGLIEVTAQLTRSDKENYQDLNVYYLTGMMDEGLPSHITQYARIVAENHHKRELIKQALEVEKICYDNSKSYNTVVKRLEHITTNLQSLTTAKEFDLSKLIHDTQNAVKTPINLINFGFNSINQLAGGMTRGEVSVIAGRPGHGKTTFVINLINNFLADGKKVMIFNREMTNIEMIKKLIALRSPNLTNNDIRLGGLNEEFEKEMEETLTEIKEKFNNQLIMFDDVFSITDTMALINKYKPDIVIDDHIQLVRTHSKHEGRRHEIDNICVEYKMISKKLKLCTILVSQLNRNIEHRIDPVPKMSDLAESGSIEQIAENVLFVYYEYNHKYKDSELGPNKIEIVAAKVRFGTTGRMVLGFEGDKCKFYETIPNIQRGANNEITVHIPEDATTEETVDIFDELMKGD